MTYSDAECKTGHFAIQGHNPGMKVEAKELYYFRLEQIGSPRFVAALQYYSAFRRSVAAFTFESTSPCDAQSIYMKNNRKKSEAELAKGQVWKMENAYLQIMGRGKRLIEYKMMKEPGKQR